MSNPLESMPVLDPIVFESGGATVELVDTRASGVIGTQLFSDAILQLENAWEAEYATDMIQENVGDLLSFAMCVMLNGTRVGCGLLHDVEAVSSEGEIDASGRLLLDIPGMDDLKALIAGAVNGYVATSGPVPVKLGLKQ